MKLLKHLFITGFNTFSLAILFGGIYLELFDSTIQWHIRGAIVSSFVVVFFFSKLFLRPIARTDENLYPFTFSLLLGVVASVYYSYEQANFIDLALSILVFSGWLLYLKWFSVFEPRKDNKQLKVGFIIPNFPIQKTDKTQMYSHDLLGSPLIILFYRGNWCPFCMAQIKEIAQQYQELEKRGAKVLLISNQPHEYSESLNKKFNMNLLFLVDKDNLAAKQLDIESKFGIPGGFQVLGFDSDTAMPTLIITDKYGKILFADLTDNYRVRPEPDIFLKILDKQPLG
jgi:peroxiredoxin